MQKIEIKHNITGEILVAGEYASVKECLEKTYMTSLHGAALTGVNLKGTSLYGIMFNGAILTGAIFNEANLHGATFNEANLLGAMFNETALNRASFHKATLREVDFHRAKLYRTSFDRANLQGANFTGSTLSGTSFDGANLDRVTFGEASFHKVSFTQAKLDGVRNYVNSHDFLGEIVRRQSIDTFTPREWAMIGQIMIDELRWESIQKRFGKKILRVFKKLAKAGFTEWLDCYRLL